MLLSLAYLEFTSLAIFCRLRITIGLLFSRWLLVRCLQSLNFFLVVDDVGVYMAGFLLFNLWAKGEQIDFDALERKRLEDKSMARATDFMSV